MLLKLRARLQGAAGRASIRSARSTTAARQRHGDVLAAPAADAGRAQRRPAGVAIEQCRFTSTSATPAATASSGSRSSRIRPIEMLPELRRGPGAEAAVVARHSVQGHPASTSPTTRRRARRGADIEVGSDKDSRGVDRIREVERVGKSERVESSPRSRQARRARRAGAPRASTYKPRVE